MTDEHVTPCHDSSSGTGTIHVAGLIGVVSCLMVGMSRVCRKTGSLLTTSPILRRGEQLCTEQLTVHFVIDRNLERPHFWRAHNKGHNTQTVPQHYEFNTRVEKEEETVAEFMAAIRKIMEHCNYTIFLNDMLCDPLVCGIREKRVQCWYLQEATITYKQALDMDSAADTAT